MGVPLYLHICKHCLLYKRGVFDCFLFNIGHISDAVCLLAFNDDGSADYGAFKVGLKKSGQIKAHNETSPINYVI